MKKKLLLLLTLPLIIGCSAPKKDDDTTTKDGYFKQFEERVNESEQEYSFISLYDDISNRFKVEFIYDLHFGFSLKITEYDLFDWYHAPNEGEFASDYESVIFTFSDESSSDLFKKGKYVLYHSLINNIDSFKLLAVDTEYKLTTTSKDAPIHINGDLVGKFVYQENNEDIFTLESIVSSKEDGLKSTITLKEGDIEFTTTNLSFKSASTTFTLNADKDGGYLKSNTTYTFKYIENTETWQLSNKRDTYNLIKLEEEKEEKDGYFYKKISRMYNDHFTLDIESNVGEDRRFVILSELDEGGKTCFSAFFEIKNDGESLVNMNSLSGKIIFTSGATIEFKHEDDQVKLYKDNTLLFDDIAVTFND